MKKIKLTKGLIALVDDNEFEKLNKHKWFSQKKGDTFYARRYECKNGKIKRIYMHREILELKNKKEEVDHINKNGIDNRKENMRICTHQQNQWNTKKRTGISQFKGVHWHKKANKWQGQIRCNNKWYYLGLYNSETEAAHVYNKKAKELHGEFAQLNA